VCVSGAGCVSESLFESECERMFDWKCDDLCV